MRRRYPWAVAAGPEHGESGLRDAIRWVMRTTADRGGQPLVYAPGKSEIRDAPLLEEYTKRPGVAVGTWRGIAAWSGGPVLAAWPSREKLGLVADDSRTAALVVVPWVPGELDAWIAAAQPEVLGPATATTSVSLSDLDPVVSEGLKALTAMVNHANNLAGSLDRRDAVAVLRTLKRAGYSLPADIVHAWALIHGWPARGAERLRQLAIDFEAGRRPQMQGRSPLREDILEIWRRAAEGEG